jgi:hypothetical protein
LRRDAGVAQGEFERSEALFVLPHTFGEEDFLGDHILAQFVSSNKFRIDPRRENLTQRLMKIV